MMTEHDLAERIRRALADAGDVREVKMFGGVGFMLNGNLVAAASKRGLLARVGEARQKEALTARGAKLMEMRGRTMTDYIRLDLPALEERTVATLLGLAVAFVKTLPAKASRRRRMRPDRKTS
jgi:TfoX/Sxy family transcriptional regulator of competence genes